MRRIGQVTIFISVLVTLVVSLTLHRPEEAGGLEWPGEARPYQTIHGNDLEILNHQFDPFHPFHPFHENDRVGDRGGDLLPYLTIHGNDLEILNRHVLGGPISVPLEVGVSSPSWILVSREGQPVALLPVIPSGWLDGSGDVVPGSRASPDSSHSPERNRFDVQQLSVTLSSSVLPAGPCSLSLDLYCDQSDHPVGSVEFATWVFNPTPGSVFGWASRFKLEP